MLRESPTPVLDKQREVRVGVTYGIAAYMWWGLAPIYFKAVAHVSALEVLAHRVTWSVVMLAGLILLQGRFKAAIAMIRHRRTAILLVGSTVLITFNWFTFIWAVANDQLLEASLGYFINPLVNISLGFVFLRERLRRWQIVSVMLAGGSVAYLTIDHGRLPWISLVLAFSFGFYALLRKVMRADSLVGLTAETTLLSPLAIGYVLYLAVTGTGAFGEVNWQTNTLLLLAGVVTAVPLLFFAGAARRLRLATVGFLQYLAPTLQFLLAVLFFGEVFSRAHMISFGCIWAALLIYSADAVVMSRRVLRAAGAT